MSWLASIVGFGVRWLNQSNLLLVFRVRSREELAIREKLISEYGFSAISEFDEDGNILKTNDKVRDAN